MFKMKNFYSFLLFFLVLTGIIGSCRKDIFVNENDARLEFSVDTLLFDTVFTTIGTVTREFKAYNRSNRPVLISSIELAGGGSSSYRMNVDGRQGVSISDILLEAHDSLYVFVEATIDPLNVNSPLVVQDSIVFNVNGNLQDIDLVAWGQDVHLVNGEIFNTADWINDKPYLVYNSMLVDTLETLTLEAGVHVFFHKGSTMYVSGTLKVLGTLEEPVTFTGDRLDELYKDIPGQWGGIYFINGSKQNEIHNATIINGTTGIHLGNFYSQDQPPDLQLRNVIIEHMTFAGLSSIGGSIYGENCVVADCGFYLAALTTGGNYEFYQTTFANYWSWSGRNTGSLLITNYYVFNDTAVFTGDLTMATFGNCIIHGNKDNEIELSNLEGAGSFNYFFDHCLVKVDTSVHISDTNRFRSPFVNEIPGFVSPYDYNLEPDTLAFVQDKGSVEIATQIPVDLLGNDRLKDGLPDLGAYERVEVADSAK